VSLVPQTLFGLAKLPPEFQQTPYPFVSASGSERPSEISDLKWLASTVYATAVPTAPPICCDVLIRPETRPASPCATPASAAD
jgi:hypothetical protein